MRILITGGAGFIGSHLADLHLAAGDQVQVVDDLSNGQIANLEQHAESPDFSLDVEDLGNWPGLEAAVARAGRIYHLAAAVGVRQALRDPLETIDANVRATRSLLDAVSGSESPAPVLVASSSEVYGFNPRPRLRENDALLMHSADHARWSGAMAKLMDESTAMLMSERRGLSVVIARLFSTVGPRQLGHHGMVVPNFVRQAVAGTPLTVFGDGRQIRSFIDVRDTVRALRALMDEPRSFGRIVNVGQDRGITIGDLAKLVIARAGSRSKILSLSYGAAYGRGYRDVAQRVPRLRVLRALTGFRHQFSLEQTLDELIAGARPVPALIPRADRAVLRGGRSAA